MLEITRAHVPGAGLVQLVSSPSAPFHASMVVVSPLPRNAHVMQAGEEPTAVKVCHKSVAQYALFRIN